ncbi:MAG: hypothetical protein LQ342_002931 [Letrouitia transgressa]|nr:MAG: hypothetical protein LQ342_002931 [Letrouitia transgressa]
MASRILPFGRSSHHPHRKDHKSRPTHRDALSAVDTSVGEQKHLSTAMDIFHFGSKEKRRSASGTSSPKGKASPHMAPTKPARIDVEMESPPLVFYGPPASSSGALLSGQLQLTITEPELAINTIHLDLIAHVTSNKPVQKDCPDCTTKSNVLFSWEFISEPTTYLYGSRSFPFSHLLPGHLPATTSASLGKIDYLLRAKAVTALGENIDFTRSLRVQRALQPSPDKESVRVFPPTNIAAKVIVAPIIHPIGEFLVQFRLNGVVEQGKDATIRWRLRKFNWRIDEHHKIISQPCPKHAHKVGGEGKGIFHEDMRSIGWDEIKKGWKTDFDAPDGGQIELEFPASIRPGKEPVCDVTNSTGLEASHALIVEMVVSEEHVRNKNPRQVAPTGIARILRLQVHIIVTERGGLGISWDEEQPPMYEDVPMSPPGYSKVLENLEGLPDELEQL